MKWTLIECALVLRVESSRFASKMSVCAAETCAPKQMFIFPPDNSTDNE